MCVCVFVCQESVKSKENREILSVKVMRWINHLFDEELDRERERIYINNKVKWN